MQVSLPTQYNDQEQAPVGALSGALGRIQANRPLRELREIAKGVTKQLPEAFQVMMLLMFAQYCNHGNAEYRFASHTSVTTAIVLSGTNPLSCTKGK